MPIIFAFIILGESNSYWCLHFKLHPPPDQLYRSMSVSSFSFSFFSPRANVLFQTDFGCGCRVELERCVICIHAHRSHHRQQTGDGSWRGWPSLDSLVATAECVITLGVPMTPAQPPGSRANHQKEIGIVSPIFTMSSVPQLTMKTSRKGNV